MILLDARVSCPYEIISIELPDDSVHHLANLGLKVGSRLELVSKTKQSAIVMLKANRLAFDASILSKVEVREAANEVAVISLSELPVGRFATIQGIFAVNESKRRLMDMGLTRHTKVYLRKVAPLGDPIEISLRGYELSLRKSEAQLISVAPIEEEK
ncbi:ferrous iron transport protein A [Streptococcus gallinaceus]|uniref:Ferrous iron transport protein A n=1 Tax=Streptococcus gallinaceus TaxID=165758 RepID=A0ABV2JP22_9STRE|nr:ferrous iron transport protein A [Streptococcus gallinaceus]